MISNYIKTALRYLQRNKLYALVNIVGLAIGITSCLLIGIYIWHELRYDRFHKNADRLARVTWEYRFGDATSETAMTGTKVGPQLQRTFPEVEQYCRTLKIPRVLAYGDKLFEEKNFLYADSSFFSLFSFPLLKGNPATVLDAPDKLVLTESMARKYFNGLDPLGKTLRLGNTKDFLITGVAADPPSHSQLQFDFIGSFKSLAASKTEKWSEANYVTYLLLQNQQAFGPLQNKVTAYALQVAREEMDAQGSNYMRYHLEPFTKVHLHSKLDGFEPNSNIVYIYVMAGVALLILLIAGVNYTNLSTAQSAGRSTEIGIRMVMGAGRQQVFHQFIGESYVVTLAAVVLALLFSALLMPFFNELTGKNLDSFILLHPVTLLALAVLSVIVAFAAGAYPALVLSGSKVMQVLKAGFQFTGSGALRKSLIVFQFIVSLFLIITTIVMLQQLAYIQNKELGYNKEQVLVLPVDAGVLAQYDAFKKALLNTTGVTSVAGAYESPVHIGWSDGLRTGAEGKSISIHALPADEHIVKTLGLKIIAGSDYSNADVLSFDTTDEGQHLRYTFILNESAARALGWTPQEAIGKTVVKGREGVVKAVVQDFHFRSFHEAISPLAIFLDRRMLGSLFIRMEGSNTAAQLRSLERVWKQRVPYRPFEYTFLDEEYSQLYQSEQRMADVFTSFSTLAILLACLGLFALTAFAMARRTKEIGIRKVLGATVADILALVSKDFIRLVLLAVIIAVPLSLWVVHKWLESFVYKTEVHWWVFAFAGAITLGIAFLTISTQAVKTALSNPVKNLRTD